MKVKDLMIPIGELTTLGVDAELGDVAKALQEAKHRDVVIIDARGAFAGILTMTDILLELEPNYKKLAGSEVDTDTLAKRYVQDIFKEYNLWADALPNLCRKGCETKVSEAMYVPPESERVGEEEDLEVALHRFILGTHQPLVVGDKKEVTGIIRLTDVFDEIIKRMYTCACELKA